METRYELPRRRARFVRWLSAVSTVLFATTLTNEALAVTGPFSWKGYTWKPTTGSVAGVVPADPANVVVDSNGYLHLKITKSGSAWRVAEVFTSVALGFGTYQWQISGPLDRMDHSVVLGLFPYGPEEGIGVDGTNEIDTEFSVWNDELGHVNADWGVYPPTMASMHWEDAFLFSLNGESSATTRMVWRRNGIKSTLMSGFQPIGGTANVLQTYDYIPNQPDAEIPQQALPLGMNLWCYKVVPASGQDVEIVIVDFQFVPEDASAPLEDAGAEAGAAPTGAGLSPSPLESREGCGCRAAGMRGPRHHLLLALGAMAGPSMCRRRRAGRFPR